jgi:hypothetical protein
VGAYIHNTPSPSLTTIVKTKPIHTATAKGTMVGRGATTIERQDTVSGIQKTCLEVDVTCIQLTIRSEVMVAVPVNITVHST